MAAGFHLLEASSALAAVAHCVDWRPLRTCVMCPSTVGVAFVGQYLAALAALSPGNDWKFPDLTAQRREDLTCNLMVQWRYSIRFFVDGRSYALQWYSVERVGWAIVVERAVVGICVGDCIVPVLCEQSGLQVCNQMLPKGYKSLCVL